MPDLKDLRDKREEILKAELAAWLHDVGKFCNLHIESHTSGSRSWGNGGSYKAVVSNPRTILNPAQTNNWIRNHLSARFLQVLQNRTPTFYTEFHSLTSSGPQWENFLTSCHLTLPSLDTFSIAELIMLGLPGASKPAEIQACFTKYGWLPAALGICHGIAHHDKQDGDGPQGWPDVFISTAFGFEVRLKNLDSILQQLPMQLSQIKEYVFNNFVHGLGDTRRPTNEVTLLDWAWTVAALYKAAISHAVLDQPSSITDRQNHNLRWRLLSIRTDGLSYLLSAGSIPDMLARRDILKDAWNKVQKVLEEEYPLGLEVYRDENGPVFVVPDLDVLGLTDSAENRKTLREYILEAFQSGTVKNNTCLSLQGEVVPTFNLDDKGWSGQGSDLPLIGQKHLREVPPLRSDPIWVAQQWCNLPKPREVCPVCGLRPQGPSQKALARKMCDVCEERRADRAKAWAVNLGRAFLSTIWLDEVADRHGRIALLVGSFDLKHWLDGILVRSLAVRTPNDQNGHTAADVAKNPSFARLRRIWETTRKFWEETLEEARSELTKRPRIFLKGTLQGGSLGPYHAYELEIQGRKVAVLWVPEDATDDKGNALEYRGGFWVIENLEYLKGEQIFGRDLREILAEGTSYAVYEPTEYGRPGQPVATFRLDEILPKEPQENEKISYTPLIPILAEPRTFMALVPADKAFEVVKAIKAKYEREMGRVRNRLPLHLGIVFADAHQPLRTILDAGRRMLKRSSPVFVGEVRNVKQFGKPHHHPSATRGWRALRLLRCADLLKHQPDQFRVLIGVRIEDGQSHRDFIWYIPAVMGDGQTEDHWYPYVFWVQDKEGNTEPANATKKRHRYYKALNPFNPDKEGNPQLGWLVHAGELQPGDRIYFTPATFDFIFLDHGGRRFEIAYDGQGRRRGTLHLPYLLDEIEELEACWRLLAGEKREINGREEPIRRLSSRQLHQIRDLIETKRAEWFEKPEDSPQNETFRRFCADVLKNAEWTTRPTEKEFQRLTQWAVSGLLADAVELFYHIMKQRPIGEAHGDTGNTEP